MTGLSRQKITGFLAAVFVAGAAAGLAGGYQWGRRTAFRPPPPRKEMADSMMQRLTSDYQLSPEQVTKIEPIVADVSQRMRQLHREQFKQFGALMKECNERISVHLDDTQKQKLAEREARHLQRLKDHERGPEGRDGRGGPPPGFPPPGPPPDGDRGQRP